VAANPDAVAKRKKRRAAVSGTFWLLTAMFRTDPPPSPQSEETGRVRRDTAGDPPKN